MSRFKYHLTPTVLPLRPAMLELAKDMADSRDNFEEGQDLLDYFASTFMEDMSEATYGEARPHGRLSCRALANIIRVDDGLKELKRLIEYERNEYNDFAVANVIVSALCKYEPLAAALPLLKNTYKSKTSIAYYPRRTELRLKTDSNWSFHCVAIGKRSPETQQSIKALAGLFRVNLADLNVIAAKMVDVGCKPEDLEMQMAEVVVESVRTCPRMVPGLAFA